VGEIDETMFQTGAGEDVGFTLDLSQASVVPQGVLLLQVHKVTRGKSKKDNYKADVQLKVLGGEDDKFNGRIVFDTLTFTAESAWKVGQFVKGFLGEVPDGPFTFRQELVLGQQCWCLVVPEDGSGDYAGQTRSKVKKYGVDPNKTAL
jgi:hypothetical protein